MSKNAQLVVVDPEFAALIPKSRPDELAGLEESLSTEGCRDALVVWAHNGDRVLLDGHNRHEICERLGIPFSTTVLEFSTRDEARLWILRNQASRRNLSDDQRAIVLDEIIEQQSIVVRARQLAAARSAKAAKNGDVSVLNDVFKTEKVPINTRTELSAQHHLSKRKSQYARLLRKADPAAAQAVKEGTTLLADAVRAVKKRQMVEQIESIQAMQAKAVQGTFDVIVADPPWDTDKIARDCRPMDVQFGYPPMAIDEIASLVGGMLEKHAEQNCHFFLWTTLHFLPDAIELVKQWGVRYCLVITWVKTSASGRHAGMKPFDLPTHNSELVVYGRRGTPKFFDTRGFYTAFEAPVRRHSEKPPEFYSMIKKATLGRRLDMFARGKARGLRRMGQGGEAELSEQLQLVNYDAARSALQKAHRVDEVKLIRDWAEAMRAYAKQANDTEMQTLAVKIKLRATRRLGEVEKQQRDKGEIAKKSQGRRKRNSDNVVAVSKPTLKELGIDRRLSAMGAKLFAIPESKFEAIVAETGTKDKELTSAAVLRVAVKAPERAAKQEKIAREARAGGQALPTGTLFPVILADCPWEYDFSETSAREIKNQYVPEPIDFLCNGIFDEPDGSTRDVRSLFAEDAVIFFWATAPKLLEGLRVLKSWGFQYKTQAVWDKEKIGMGYWFRGQHEILCVGTQGNISVPLPEDRVSSVIRESRTSHSKKPIAVYEIIEKYFPDLPKLELFGRADREGWVSWGNQLNMAARSCGSMRANESEQAPVRTQ